MKRMAGSRSFIESRRVTLTAADELHNFVAIARRDERVCPLRARQNLEIALDRHAAAIEAKLAQEIRDACAGFRGAIFAVHRYRDGRLQNFTLPRELSAWRATENAS